MNKERLKKAIDAIFEEATCQSDALISIYRIFFPDWDEIEQISGWPSCDEELWKYICGKFQKLDHQYHPNCLPGGLWLNKGFSGDKNLKGWEVDMSTCQLIYKEATNAEKRIA